MGGETPNVNWRRTAALLLPWERAGEELARMGRLFGGEGGYLHYQTVCMLVKNFDPMCLVQP